MKIIRFLVMDITALGGIERVVCNLSNSFIDRGHKVSIISLFKSNNNIEYPLSSNVHIYYVHNSPIINYRLNFIKFIFSSNFKNIFTNSCITISTYSVFSILLSIFKGSYSKNIIAAEHSAFGAHNFLIQLLRLIFYRKLRNVVVLTSHDFSIFSRFMNNVILIPNSVTEFNNCNQFKLNYLKLPFKCIAIGRFSKVKRYDIFIKLAAYVYTLNPEIPFILMGSGNEFDYYSLLVSSYKGEINIEIINSNNNPSNLYSSASALIITSETEAFPMVLIEANSFGVPVISIECQIGPLEMIQDGLNGYIYPEKDFIQLASDKIIELFEDNQLRHRLSVGSIKSSLSYRINNVTDKWLKIL